MAPEIVRIPAEFNVSPPLVTTAEMVSAAFANVIVLIAPPRFTLPAMVTALVPPAAWPKVKPPFTLHV